MHIKNFPGQALEGRDSSVWRSGTKTTCLQRPAIVLSISGERRLLGSGESTVTSESVLHFVTDASLFSISSGGALATSKLCFKHGRWLIRRTPQQEQFTEEWDWVKNYPREKPETTGTAGEYSWRTNLFHIGLTMQSLITLHAPPHRPKAWRYKWTPLEDPSEDSEPGPDPFGHDTQRKKLTLKIARDAQGKATRAKTKEPPLGPGERWAYSYGWPLRMKPFVDGVDKLLLKLVWRCLSHKPTDRPSLEELMGFVEAMEEQIATHAPKTRDQDKQDHVDPLLNQPPFKRMRRFEDLDPVSFDHICVAVIGLSFANY